MASRNLYRVDAGIAYIHLTDRRGATIAEAMVDATDVERVLEFGRWRKGRGGYVYTCIKDNDQRLDIALHRFLLSAPEGMVVDHINHNPLDNRRVNLRVLTKAQNMQNRRGPVQGKRDPFRNVYRQTKGGGYVVRVSGRYFGTYRTLKEADKLARSARKSWHIAPNERPVTPDLLP